eukprot:16597-Eustigmatos_ZCMA.PRE.1
MAGVHYPVSYIHLTAYDRHKKTQETRPGVCVSASHARGTLPHMVQVTHRSTTCREDPAGVVDEGTARPVDSRRDGPGVHDVQHR